MSRHFLFVLLLAMGVALIDDRPEAQAQHASAAAEAQTKTEAAQGRKEHAQTKTEAAQGRTEHEQGKTEATQAQTEHQQSQSEEAQGQIKEAEAQTDEGAKLISVPGGKALGMSILGNQDAPKSLVIVPWKSSELGDSPGISPMLDDSRQPVDKEVFMRALLYYEIRSKAKP
jgi:hypothetical protein